LAKKNLKKKLAKQNFETEKSVEKKLGNKILKKKIWRKKFFFVKILVAKVRDFFNFPILSSFKEHIYLLFVSPFLYLLIMYLLFIGVNYNSDESSL